MAHCCKCLKQFARQSLAEKHQQACEDEPPTLAKLTMMVYALSRKLEATEKKLDATEKELKKRDYAHMQPVCPFPELAESDLLGFFDKGIIHVVENNDWPVKVCGKSLELYKEEEWVFGTSDMWDEFTHEIYKRLHTLFTVYRKKTNMDETDEEGILPLYCQKLSALATVDVKKAFLACK